MTRKYSRRCRRKGSPARPGSDCLSLLLDDNPAVLIGCGEITRAHILFLQNHSAERDRAVAAGINEASLKCSGGWLGFHFQPQIARAGQFTIGSKAYWPLDVLTQITPCEHDG